MFAGDKPAVATCRATAERCGRYVDQSEYRHLRILMLAAFSPPKPPPMMTTRVFRVECCGAHMAVWPKCERPMNACFTRFAAHADGRDHCSVRRVQGLPVASHSHRRQSCGVVKRSRCRWALGRRVMSGGVSGACRRCRRCDGWSGESPIG